VILLGTFTKLWSTITGRAQKMKDIFHQPKDLFLIRTPQLKIKLSFSLKMLRILMNIPFSIARPQDVAILSSQKKEN
jgi:hypothetical protein